MAQVKITIIETLDDITVVRCRGCGGIGSIRPSYSNDYRHKACGGAGIVAIQHSAPLMICQGCGGNGSTRHSYSNDYRHKACGGTGIVAAWGDFRILPRNLK